METTMIQIKKDTVKVLKDLKKYSKQSYDEVIKNLISNSEAEMLTEREKNYIEDALKDVKSGRVHKIEDVAKNLGVRLKN